MANQGSLSLRGILQGPFVGARAQDSAGSPSYAIFTTGNPSGGGASTFYGLRYRTLPSAQPLSMILVFGETLSLTENLAVTSSVSQTVTETLNLSDSVTVQRTVFVDANETLNLTEGLQFVFPVALSETLAIVENLFSSSLTSATLSETLTLSEGVSFAFPVSVVETLTLSDTLNAVLTRLTVLTETLNLAESLTFSNAYSELLSITHTLSESLQTQYTTTVGVAETLTLSDFATAFSSGVIPVNATKLQVTFRGPVKEGLVSDPSRYVLIPTGVLPGVPARITSVSPLRNLLSSGVATIVGTDPYTRQVDLGYGSAQIGQTLVLTGTVLSVNTSIIAVAGSVVTLSIPILALSGPITWDLYSPPYGVEVTHTEMTDGRPYFISLGPLASVFGNTGYRQETEFTATGVSPTEISASFLPEDASVLITFDEDMSNGDTTLLDPNLFVLTGPTPAKVVEARWVKNDQLWVKTWGISSGLYTLTLPPFKDLAQNVLITVP